MVILTGFLALNKIVSFGSITVESLTTNIFNSVGNIINFKIEMDTVKPLFKKFEDFKNISNNLIENKIKFNEEIEKISLKNISYSYSKKDII